MVPSRKWEEDFCPSCGSNVHTLAFEYLPMYPAANIPDTPVPIILTSQVDNMNIPSRIINDAKYFPIDFSSATSIESTSVQFFPIKSWLLPVRTIFLSSSTCWFDRIT